MIPSKYIGYLIIASLLIIPLLIQSCAGSKKWKKDIEGPILFGSYGGFAGSFDEYTIHQDGRVFHKSKLKGDQVQVHQLKEDLKKEIFERIKSDKIFEFPMDEPGNMTYFLKFTYKDEPYHIKWGGQNDPFTELLTYYNLLSSNIKGKNPVM